MKKRFLSLSLALCMVLTACGSGGEEKQTTDGSSPAPSETSSESASAGVEKGPVQTSDTEKVSSKDTLVVAFDREPATLDPLGNNVTVKRMIEGSIFDTLLEFNENMDPSP